MKRNILKLMEDWKVSKYRKPLILKGARQVGKTWAMIEFGEKYYEDYFYFNFDEEEELKSIFEGNKEPMRIIELIGMIKGKKILPEKHLIIFDEVQECPAALNSLKYFCEKANEYHIMAAGSLLGTLLAKPKSYPVGKVNIINIYPMTFDEFLMAIDEGLYEYYSSVKKGQKIEDFFHKRLSELYNYYLIIGGMPECVKSWIDEKSPERIEQIHKELIALYENDFSKHNGSVNSGRILMVFRSIVTQLGKNNEKFVYGVVKNGARAREFEEAIEWLVSAGMVIRIYNVSKPEHPLNAFQVLNHFKLFVFDVGLLKTMAGVSNEAILLKKDFQFKGALTENYILQQMREIYDIEPKYFAPSANCEIDFVFQEGINIIPAEVKSGGSVNAKSFKEYVDRYKPVKAVRYSLLGYEVNDRFTNVPLYLAGRSRELV